MVNAFKRPACDGLADHGYGCTLCHQVFDSGTPEFALAVLRHLDRIYWRSGNLKTVRGAQRIVELIWY